TLPCAPGGRWTKAGSRCCATDSNKPGRSNPDSRKKREGKRMTSVTETVIRGQFPYLKAALAQPMPSLPAGMRVFVGCGTSFYLARTLAAVSNGLGHPAIAVPGAEWTHYRRSYLASTEDTVVIGLSRSGTTTETVAAIRASRAWG